MKNTNKIYYIIVILLIVITVIQIFEPTIGAKIAVLLTSITTVVGIVSIFLEMKRAADVAECEFIFLLQQHFETNIKIQDIYAKLEDDYLGDDISITKKDHMNIVSYLTFLDMLCNLILKRAVVIKDIDDLFAYPFFIAVNSKKIQEHEIIPFKDYYRNIYQIYPLWVAYRIESNKPIPYSETPLI